MDKDVSDLPASIWVPSMRTTGVSHRPSDAYGDRDPIHGFVHSSQAC